ncbi:MAG TPA: hypothetical protein VIY29_09920 [Ktedonobacteraceae bacterium]
MLVVVVGATPHQGAPENGAQGKGAQEPRYESYARYAKVQDATTVLSIIRKRGEQGLPITRLYRQLYNPQLYYQAYARLYSNDGAMTPDTTGETVDGMSREKIGTMIELIRQERWRWTPVTRIYIPKRNGKRRPLGLPSWSSKVMQEVVRQLLDAYFEPHFSEHSHGFRERHAAATRH